MRVSNKAARARRRSYEKKEAAWWAAHGFEVQLNWSEATYIPGRGFTPRAKDFFERFDLVGVHPRFHVVAWIQVTESPMQGRGVHRNADHGEPRWAWAPPSDRTVEEWIEFRDLETVLDTRSVQVVVSYQDARHPVRKWWAPKENGGADAKLGQPHKPPRYEHEHDVPKEEGRSRV